MAIKKHRFEINANDICHLNALCERYKMQQRARGFVLYGQNRLQPQQWIDWYETITEYAESINCPFVRGCCDPGNSYNYVSMEECKRTMDERISNIQNVELSGLANNYEDIDIYKEEPIYCTTGSYFSELKYLFAHDLSYGTAKEFIEVNFKMLDILKPQYGFWYCAPIVRGAYRYDCGGLWRSGLCDIVDAKNDPCNERFNKLQKYVNECVQNGKLREIYVVNIINDKHLNNYVFPNTTLQEWIKADTTRGEIDQLTDELYMWLIDDNYLQQITEELAPSDMLLVKNEKYPQRYDYGLREEDQLPLSTVINGRTIEEWALMSLQENSGRFTMEFAKENRIPMPK